jgi:hypothetical protein
MIPNKKMPKQLICEVCDFVTSKESNYITHKMTRKHEILTNPNKKMPQDMSSAHTCKCGKSYKHLSTLCSHRKICISESIAENTVLEILLKENTEFKNIILDVVKNNNELQKQMFEMCKNGNTVNSYNNSNNKTFNLQFFLNEQCKDAMNISEFVKTFDLQLTDLESVGELGYVEGITKIMIDKLNSMDIYKRPIHCSDAKREIMYVKDEDKWEKEGRNNPKLRHAIKTVSFQNMKLANLWSNTYPESKNNESYLNDTYMKLIRQSTGGSGDINNSEDKIIRRIAKEVIIGKM